MCRLDQINLILFVAHVFSPGRYTDKVIDNNLAMDRKRKAINSVTKRHFNRKVNALYQVICVASEVVKRGFGETDQEASDDACSSSVSAMVEESSNQQDDISEIDSSHEYLGDELDEGDRNDEDDEDSDRNDDKEVPMTEENQLSHSKLRTRLAKGVVEENIRHTSIKKLLKILKEELPICNELPGDSRTLLKTPRSVQVKSVPPGHYYHFGLLCGLERGLEKMEQVFDNMPDILKLYIGIDRLPVFGSSGSQLWPILFKIVSLPDPVVFFIGIYHGLNKPRQANKLLEDFVSEVIDLINNGVTFKGREFQIDIANIICDAPAKSFITYTKGHSGFYSCSKCAIKGDYKLNRVCFSGNTASLRTHADFIKQAQEEHHTGISVLTKYTKF